MNWGMHWDKSVHLVGCLEDVLGHIDQFPQMPLRGTRTNGSISRTASPSTSDRSIHFVEWLVDSIVVTNLHALVFLGEALGMLEDAKRIPEDRLVIDARELSPFLQDLPPNATRGMHRAREGFDGVLLEIFDLQEKIGGPAGVLSRDVEELRLLTERLELIRKHMPGVRKLLELMVETELVLDNRRQQIVRMIARTIDNAAYLSKDDTLLGGYENTRRYRSAPGKKAVKTRQRRAALAKEAEARKTAGDAMAEVAVRQGEEAEKPH